MNIFRSLHHVCIVVRDIDKAVAYYDSVGIGPWHPYPPLQQFTELTGYDRDVFLAMKYKYANIDNVQIQLCQPGSGDSEQRRFLDSHGEGVFHLGFVVPDCDAGEAAGKDLGLKVLMSGRRPDRTGFTYFDTAGPAGVVLEIRASPKA